MVRVVLAFCALRSYQIDQLDYEAAFTNRIMDKLMFAMQQEGLSIRAQRASHAG